jgi:hypothetical protein
VCITKQYTTVNQNEILATKTVWHEILLRYRIFAYHWTSSTPKISKKLKKAKKNLKAKPQWNITGYKRA